MEIRAKRKLDYEEAVNNYLITFKNIYFKNVECNDYWAADDVGGIVVINDYFFSFKTIKYAVDNRIKVKDLFTWYDKCLSDSMNNIEAKTPTLEEWWKEKIKIN